MENFKEKEYKVFEMFDRNLMPKERYSAYKVKKIGRKAFR